MNFLFLSHPILEILWFHQKTHTLCSPSSKQQQPKPPSSRGQWYFFAMACSSRPSWDPKRLVKLPMPNFTAFGVRFLIFCGEKREVGLINVGYKNLDSNYEFSSSETWINSWCIFKPSEKYARQIGFPQVGMKIDDIWNHHLVNVSGREAILWLNKPPSKLRGSSKGWLITMVIVSLLRIGDVGPLPNGRFMSLHMGGDPNSEMILQEGFSQLAVCLVVGSQPSAKFPPWKNRRGVLLVKTHGL